MSKSTRVASLVLCAVVALETAGLLGPTLASAALSNPIGVLGEESPQTTATTATQTTASSSNSNSGTAVVLGVGAAGVLLAGVAFMIVRDARRVAPAGDGFGRGGTARDPAVVRKKRRAQAKAARRQRKRNR